MTADEIRTLECRIFDAFKMADALLELCRGAPALFVNQTPEEQARLIGLVDSNSRWDEVTLKPTYRTPFDLLAEGPEIMSGCAEARIIRNFEAFIQSLEALAREPLGAGYEQVVAA